MSRIAYVNGRYLRHGTAMVHIEDRGYQFADGVYEVIAVHRGKLVDEGPHLDRLERSLDALKMALPVTRAVLSLILGRVVAMNQVVHGLVYFQVTRGVAPRNHAFPHGVESSLVVTSRPGPAFNLETAGRGVEIRTAPDIRWERCDIKSIALLPNVLYKEEAVAAGCFETWMFDRDRNITEGTSSNAWIVTPEKALVTRNLSRAILPGITRQAVMEIACKNNLSLVERPFTVDQAHAASEAFLTSTTSFVKPVVGIDGKPVGDGQVGPFTHQLLAWYGEYLDDEAA